MKRIGIILFTTHVHWITIVVQVGKTVQTSMNNEMYIHVVAQINSRTSLWRRSLVQRSFIVQLVERRVLLCSWFKWFILYTHTTMDVPLLCLQAVTRQCYQVLLILLNSNPTGHLCFDRETQHVIQKYKKTNSEWERTWNNQNQALLYRISQQFGAMFAFI